MMTELAIAAKILAELSDDELIAFLSKMHNSLITMARRGCGLDNPTYCEVKQLHIEALAAVWQRMKYPS
jgi:hypothetical protein